MSALSASSTSATASAQRAALDTIEPFNPIDDGHALNRLARWVNTDAVLKKILADNPARLTGF